MTRTDIFPAALAAVPIFAIAIAFSPRYWPIAAALGAVSLLGIVWAVTARSLRAAPALIPAALLALWGPVQLLTHRTAAPWLTGHACLNWLGFSIVFLLASQILFSDHARHLFLHPLLWAVTLFALLAILQRYWGAPGDLPRVYGIFPTDTQTVGTFLYKNQFAAMLELAAPIALWRALRGRENPAIGALFFAVLFAAAVASASRAGVILMSAELVCALAIALRQRRISLSAAATLAASLVVLLAAASAIAGPENILAHFQEKNPYSVRRQLLDSTLRMVREHPWTGSGLGTWRTLYPRFATFDNALVANEAHNDWAQWTAEGGIPFTCLMLVLVLSVAPAAISTIWGLGVITVMLHSLIDYPTREPALGLFWFALAGALPSPKVFTRKVAGGDHYSTGVSR